jgi:hypothetical protein
MTKRVTVILKEEELSILERLSKKIGYNWSDTIRASVLITSVMLDAGLMDLLKPLPEIIDILKKSDGGSSGSQ